MNHATLMIVRVYITESSHLLKIIIDYLKKEIKIRGISVFRAISGYGASGSHDASLIDLSLDLPLTIEFFDTKEKIDEALQYLNTIIKPEHIIYWEIKTN